MSNKSNGKYFLEPRGKKGLLSICWYDKRSIQRRSTGTADLTEAQTELDKFILTQGSPEHSQESSLFNELARYWENYAKNLASAITQKDATNNAIAVWKNDIKIKDIARDEQLKFVKHLRDKGLADSTIDRRLGCLWNAMSWSHRGGHITYVPAQIKAEDWQPNFEIEAKCYSIDQLAALFNACGPKDDHKREARDTRYSREHWWRFLVLAIGTASREAALRELCWPQIRDNAIHLNPEGRRQTKKRRAIVPMGSILADEIASWPKDGFNVVTYYGAALKSNQFFDILAKTAGIKGSANIIRHTVRTWLSKSGVKDTEADIFVGHAEEGSATGRRFYKHLNPEYLASCATAINALFEAISAKLEHRNFAGLTLEDQPLPGAALPALWPAHRMLAGQMQDK